MRKYKSILILLGILIALVALYFVTAYLIKPNQVTGNPTNTPNDISFTFFAVDDVREIEVNDKKTGDDLKFIKNSDNKTWSYTSQLELLVDNARIDDIISKMAYIPMIKLIEENPKDTARYGFDLPNILTAKLKDGSIKTIELGNKTPTSEAYYFRSSENSNIYTINLGTGTALKLAKAEVYDKKIFDFTVDDIQTLTYDKDGKSMFGFYYDPKIKMHRTLSPMKDFEVTIESFSAFAGQLIDLKKANYVAPASDASKYGFDTPSARFAIETLLQKKTLLFGTEVIKNSQVYGMIEGGKEIFLIDISAMSIKDVDVKNMITPWLFWPSIRNLSSLYIKLGSDVADCKIDINTDTTKDKFSVNGSEIVGNTAEGTNYFKDFYGTVISLEAVKFEENVKPSGSPDLTVEYTFSEDNTKVKFEFITKDKNYCYVMKNGIYIGALVEKTTFDAIAASFNEMMKNGRG